jgi:diacylglycerol kinase family enzyme
VRALLIVNPQATSTTPLRRDVIVRALGSAVELTAVQTRYRGDGAVLAGRAVAEGYGLVLTLGGDGTVNEVVNGLLAATPPRGASRPALAALPGGHGNVFTRALGLPGDPVDAAGRILAALGSGHSRSIGLGLAGHRYFTFNAGLGLDAEVVRAVQGGRAHGRPVSGALYLRTAIRQFFRVTDRHHPALTLQQPGQPPVGRLFLCFVSNTTPWTYLGTRPVYTNPEAGFDSGLDLFALRALGTIGTLRTVRQMLSNQAGPPRGRAVLTRHDLRSLVIRASRPLAFQVDGEYVGEAEQVSFRFVPDALRVIS